MTLVGIAPGQLSQAASVYSEPSRALRRKGVPLPEHDKHGRCGRHAPANTDFQRSDGSVPLPGDLGTLDETIDMTTRRQLRFHNQPIVLANYRVYWNPLLSLFDHTSGRRFRGLWIRATLTRRLACHHYSLQRIGPGMMFSPYQRSWTNASTQRGGSDVRKRQRRWRR